jgi:WD40 repeat protein
VLTARGADSGKPTDQPLAQKDKNGVDEKTIRALIKQLGDESFVKREAAAKRLTTIGEPALQLLQEAAKEDKDAEVRARAETLFRVIGKSFFQEVRRYEGHAQDPLRWATRVVVTPDGRFAVSAGSGMLRYWEIDTGKQLLAFGQSKRFNTWALSMAKDGKRVIVGSEDRIVQVFELPSGKEVQRLIGHTHDIAGAHLLADGKQAVTGAWDQSVRLWDVESGMQILSFDTMENNVRCLAVAPDGKMLAGATCRTKDASPGTIHLWNVDTGKVIRVLEGHTMNTSTVSFVADGKTLLSSSYDGTLRLWDVASGKELKRFVGSEKEGIEVAAITPDGRRVLSGGNPRVPTLRMWDVASGNLLYESEPMGGGFTWVTPLPDNQRCLTTTRDGVIRLWQWKR